MTNTVIMPQLGETVAEGKILQWLKAVGDEIKEGDNLFEVETDKVTLEVQSILSGRLNEIRVGEGVVAKVGAVVAMVGSAEAVTASTKEPAAIALSSPRSPFEEVTTPLDRFGTAKSLDGVRATPLARRLMVQNNLSLEAVVSEAEPRARRKIEEADVRAALEARLKTHAPASPAPPPTRVAKNLTSLAEIETKPAPLAAERDIVKLSAVRMRTGERLTENWRTIPHVFQAIEVDFTALDLVRQKRKEAFRQSHGFSLTFLPFIACATCLAIQAFPQINARFAGDSVILSHDVNLGVAVDLSHKGLVVPIVRNAGDLTLIGLAKAMNRQIEKARSGKLSPDDLAGGTYSISNNGAFGTTFTAPIINAPQVAILSTDAIKLKPAVVSTPQGIFLAARLIGMVGQSFDHRAFDGAYSAAFLSSLKRILEERDWAAELA